ncbi:uncharacterized protein LOC129584571 isoform X2 [Paramacrobiotus metropolitanus]|nr:uncharacterized protein LOC129584571 isoform X2 [Paramacrobiotus metropolitanus]XP_055332766.1 uncharacterized protein LOC129584571 isoform X2 [Paramacrobiotus metropolitanus]XP_055332767.1 uncharacterized protein LOC129584571 isoform X2 [Paramacrobiotus metropolitanus]
MSPYPKKVSAYKSDLIAHSQIASGHEPDERPRESAVSPDRLQNTVLRFAPSQGSSFCSGSGSSVSSVIIGNRNRKSVICSSISPVRRNSSHICESDTNSEEDGEGLPVHKVLRRSDSTELPHRTEYDARRAPLEQHSQKSATIDLPPFLSAYWDLTNRRKSALEGAVKAVTAAVDAAYGDEIELWSKFMVSAIEDGQVPLQPQATPERMLEIAAECVRHGMVRLATFASMLPGFGDFSVEDKKILVSEKYLIHWLVHHSRFIYKGEFYYLVGPENVHSSRYWLISVGQLEQDYVEYVISFAASLNSLGLTLVETYLILAVALFRPDTSGAANKDLLERTHTYYLDTLFFLFGERLNSVERALTFRKLDSLMRQFPVVQKLSVDYVSTLDLTQFPIRSSSVTFREVVLAARRHLR